MISITNLAFRYPDGKRDSLSDISVEFAEGSFTAIMGANGSGKSTLARCLNGLLLPTVGDVIVDGLNTRNPQLLPTIRRSVGLVFQDPNVQMTSPTIERELAFGLQNLGVPFEEMHCRIDRSLNNLTMTHKRLAAPSSLSGGEKQRLALESVLVLEPKYLVLDEPTSFLSPTSRRHIMENLIQTRRQRKLTLVLITQFISEACCAERLIILNNSRIVVDAAPETVLAQREQLSTFGIYVPPAF
jgi:energy-coupling factor transport system ATP-binding protein